MALASELDSKMKRGTPETSCGVVEDLPLRSRKLAVRLSLGQGDEDLVCQLRERLPSQFLLQVVFGRKIPQDTCTGRQRRTVPLLKGSKQVPL